MRWNYFSKIDFPFYERLSKSDSLITFFLNKLSSLFYKVVGIWEFSFSNEGEIAILKWIRHGMGCLKLQWACLKLGNSWNPRKPSQCSYTCKITEAHSLAIASGWHTRTIFGYFWPKILVRILNTVIIGIEVDFVLF